MTATCSDGGDDPLGLSGLEFVHAHTPLAQRVHRRGSFVLTPRAPAGARGSVDRSPERTFPRAERGGVSGALVSPHTDKAARRLCPTSLLRNIGSSYSEEPGVEIL